MHSRLLHRGCRHQVSRHATIAGASSAKWQAYVHDIAVPVGENRGLAADEPPLDRCGARRNDGGMPRELPTGVVTLLFTDIEGSTLLLHELGDRYGDALDDHRRVVR